MKTLAFIKDLLIEETESPDPIIPAVISKTTFTVQQPSYLGDGQLAKDMADKWKNDSRGIDDNLEKKILSKLESLPSAQALERLHKNVHALEEFISDPKQRYRAALKQCAGDGITAEILSQAYANINAALTAEENKFHEAEALNESTNIGSLEKRMADLSDQIAKLQTELKDSEHEKLSRTERTRQARALFNNTIAAIRGRYDADAPIVELIGIWKE